MPVLTYKDFPCVLFPEGHAKDYCFLAQSLSLTFSNKLTESWSFGRNGQDIKEFGIGGSRDCSVDIAWAVGTSGNPTSLNYNALSGILYHMTGNNSGLLQLGTHQLKGAYLSKLSVSIQPMMPVIANASFVCSPPEVDAIGASPYSVAIPPSKIAYGYSTVIAGGTNLTDGNNASIQFSLDCDRTPSYRLGDSGAYRYLLNSITKELTLDATNIQNIINFSGYGDVFSATIKNIDSETVAALSMSEASRVMSQSLTTQDGSILNGSVSLREIVF